MAVHEGISPVDGALVLEEAAEKTPKADEAVEAPLEEGSPPDEADFEGMQAGDGVPGGLPNQGFHPV